MRRWRKMATNDDDSGIGDDNYHGGNDDDDDNEDEGNLQNEKMIRPQFPCDEAAIRWQHR